MVTLGLLIVRDDVIALAMSSVAWRSRVAGPYTYSFEIATEQECEHNEIGSIS